MARGILGGMVFGGAVSVAAAAGISILLDPPTRPDVVAEAPSRTAAPVAPDKEAASGFGDADLVRDGAQTPVAAPQPEDVAAATRAGGDTPRVPEAGGAEAPSFENGTAASETALAALPQNEPVLQAPQSALPSQPGAEDDLSISTEPAQPPAPQVEDPLDSVEPSTLEAPASPVAPEVGDTEPAIVAGTTPETGPEQNLAAAPLSPSSEAAPASDTPAAQPEEVAAVERQEETAETAATQDPAPDDEEVVASDGADPVVDRDVAALEPVDQAEPTAPSDPGAAEPAEIASTPEQAQTPDTPEEELESAQTQEDQAVEAQNTDVVAQTDTRPRVGRPASSIINRASEDESTEEDAPDDAVADAAPVPSGPPLEAHAANFENPDDKPLMSIVLIDGATDLANAETGLTALKSFPYPLSFAVEATAPDATERMAAYRAAGFEVLAMMDLPSGATAQDAAVNIDAALAALPQTVALIEGPGVGLQTSADVTDQLISTLQASGHGIVLQAKGLNSAQKDAARAGVPARTVFRDFDSAGQDARTIRRFLDQAAFRAGQEGGVIMMGRLRADTISALLIWGNQDRARRIALAPVSAVLKQ